MRRKGSYVLMLLVFGLAGGAIAGGPVGVSPGGENGMAVISQECPTFSWSEVEGATSYRVKVFVRTNGEILSYEEMERRGEPVMGVEIKATALSWTPSAGECLMTGKRYVWYVGAKDGSGIESISEGRGFEVEVGASAGMKEALKETVKEYLIKEWKETESYREVKETIKAEMVKEMKGGGAVVMGSGTPVALATEGTSNTLFGSGAGNSLGDDDDYATFIGYRAGYNTADSPGFEGKYNTFVGYRSGYANTDGNTNTFLGYQSGDSNTTGSANTFVGWSAGSGNITGGSNTFLGRAAGVFNTGGYDNTFLGQFAGNSSTGSWNTFVGSGAGAGSETGSGNVFLGYEAGANETLSSRLYIDNSDISTPLIYGQFDTNLVVINGVLSIASSREYKESIDQLRIEKAMETLQSLRPVEFSYKATPSERHTGFISEEVPEFLTTRERKAISPMDIVAVLTKVVQEQQKTMERQESIVRKQEESLKELRARNEVLEQRFLALESKVAAGR